MVEKDGVKARKTRARRLRKQVSRIIESTERRPEGESDGVEAGNEEEERSESPREFIQRRMRELDRAKSKSKGKS